MTRLILLLLALFAFSAPAFAATPVDLREELIDSDGSITLGDLFDGAGRAGGVVLAVGPQAGRTAVLDAGRVQQIAWANGLQWNNPDGFRRLVVTGEAAEAVQDRAAAPAGRTVDALTWARSIAAGEMIRPEDVVWSKVQTHLRPGDAPNDVEAVIGQAARRPLREGAAVASRDLSAPVVIKKDEIIQVAYAFGGVNLVLQGRALADAATGQSVQVMNTQSKKTIEAVATGPGRAAVGPEADSLRSRSFAASR